MSSRLVSSRRLLYIHHIHIPYHVQPVVYVVALLMHSRFLAIIASRKFNGTEGITGPLYYCSWFTTTSELNFRQSRRVWGSVNLVVSVGRGLVGFLVYLQIYYWLPRYSGQSVAHIFVCFSVFTFFSPLFIFGLFVHSAVTKDSSRLLLSHSSRRYLFIPLPLRHDNSNTGYCFVLFFFCFVSSELFEL